MRARALFRRALLCGIAAATLLGAAVAPAEAADRVSVRPQVVGGQDVPDGKYPFMVSIGYKKAGGNQYERHFCGGSLIGPYVVLTAAHCMVFAPEEMVVTVGRTMLTSTQGVKRNVTRYEVHPKYGSQGYDVALVYLDRPVNKIKPIKLVTPGADALERPGRVVTAIGWGNIRQQPVGPGDGGWHQPDRLREVRVLIVSDDECAISYEGRIHAETEICAGRTNKDTCQGDSGGPLFSKVPGRDEYVQIGITSWGYGCGATGYPGVYTRLSNTEIGRFVGSA